MTLAAVVKVVYALTGGLSQARPEGSRAGVRVPGRRSSEPPPHQLRHLERAVSSSSGVQGRTRNRLVLMYFGTSMKCLLGMYMILIPIYRVKAPKTILVA